MKHFEVTLSFSYHAETPEDAVKQFIANIPVANWYVSAKDIDSKETFIVDTQDYTLEQDQHKFKGSHY